MRIINRHVWNADRFRTSSNRKFKENVLYFMHAMQVQAKIINKLHGLFSNTIVDRIFQFCSVIFITSAISDLVRKLENA